MPELVAEPKITPEAVALFRKALVWDNVWPVDLPGGVQVGNDWRQLERFAQSGVHVMGVTLAGDNHNPTQALQLVAWARRYLKRNADRYLIVESTADIELARATGRLAIILHFEGTRCFDRDLSLIEAFYALGIRQSILAFNNANSVGGGCAESHDSGLSAFGRRFVAEMQSVGMLVDLSHVGYRTSLDALGIAQRPMVFTHSNADAVHKSFRNVKDDQIIACAATGGLIGISGSSSYLGDAATQSRTLFRHIDHIVQLVGSKHAGIGLDVVFDSTALNAYARSRPDEWPMTLDSSWPGFFYCMPEQLLELTHVMLSHGYGEENILDILGRNYLRICAEVWTGPSRAQNK